jgi:hypothetical protein
LFIPDSENTHRFARNTTCHLLKIILMVIVGDLIINCLGRLEF